MKSLSPALGVLLLAACAPVFREAPPTPAMALYAGFAASVGADVASTVRFRATCPTCYETNVLMHPLVEAGPGPLVAASTLLAGGTVWLSEYLRRQPATERVWWLVPALSTVGHFVAAWQNPR